MVRMFMHGLTGRRFESASCLKNNHLDFFPLGPWAWANQRPWYVQPCLYDWEYKKSYALVKKSRASCPGGTFPPSFIHQVIIITATGQNKIMNVCSMAFEFDTNSLNRV